MLLVRSLFGFSFQTSQYPVSQLTCLEILELFGGDRQTDGQTDRQTDGQTDRQTQRLVEAPSRSLKNMEICNVGDV